MIDTSILGIDMGGTNFQGGLVVNNNLEQIHTLRVNSQGSLNEVLKDLFSFTDNIINSSVSGIGIGVPGLVNSDERMVYDVVYIPSWKKIPLQQLMEERYKIPVFVNNDANCFAVGEFYFGKGKGYNSMIGLTIGTGLGSGIIIDKKLYEGKNGGAGEFGMAEYLDHTYEYYASGQFFENKYNIRGEIIFDQASKGNEDALKMYEEMGTHLGNAIKTMLYALDVDVIILGGSVRHAFPYFASAMWKQIKTFGFQKATENLKVEVSELENAGILGAAALQYNFEQNK
ncbi:MAG: ROK family protein [Bacteroidota bacterium]|nr:ROK family protein [Bacteroidota bacterium]